MKKDNITVLVLSSKEQFEKLSKLIPGLTHESQSNDTQFDYFIIFDIASRNIEYIKNSPHKVIAHEACFKNNNFLNLSEYEQLYYKNHFEAILCNELPVETLYSYRLKPKQDLLKQISQMSPGVRYNEVLLLTNNSSKNFILHNTPLYSRFDSLVFKKYSKLFLYSDKKLTLFLQNNKISRVIINLPYRHFMKRQLLRRLKKIKFPYLVLERGALPQCLIFDDHDFNYNSKYYNKSYWDQNYSVAEYTIKNEFVSAIKDGASLEAQAQNKESLINLESIKSKANGRSIIFVPLQRPFDSVIRYFCPGGYKKFVKEIVRFADQNKEQYLLVCKKHPLEKTWPKFLNKDRDGIVRVDSSVHVNDLIKMAKAVVLINSGVGVLSMVFEKPVYHFGQIFYSIVGCNSSFQTSQELKELLIHSGTYNAQDAQKFLTYLYTKYYSIVKLKKVEFSSKIIHNFEKLKLPIL